MTQKTIRSGRIVKVYEKRGINWVLVKVIC